MVVSIRWRHQAVRSQTHQQRAQEVACIRAQVLVFFKCQTHAYQACKLKGNGQNQIEEQNLVHSSDCKPVDSDVAVTVIKLVEVGAKSKDARELAECKGGSDQILSYTVEVDFDVLHQNFVCFRFDPFEKSKFLPK